MADRKVIKIAFGCEQRVGKDASAEYVRTKDYKMPGGVAGATLSFASPLYDILWYACDRLKFKRNKSRKFLQDVGDWARAQDMDIFVKELQEEAEKTAGMLTGTNVILTVTDVRMQNEAKALKAAGFKMVRIVRERDLRVGYNAREADHWTEKDLLEFQGWDEVIVNNGSVAELHAKLDEMMQRFGFQ